MTSLKVRVVVSGLTGKGFRESEGDHRYLVLYVNDIKQSIWTKISRSSRKEIGETLIHQMARQTRLTKPQFLDLVHCPLEYEDYVSILRDKGVVLHE